MVFDALFKVATSAVEFLTGSEKRRQRLLHVGRKYGLSYVASAEVYKGRQTHLDVLRGEHQGTYIEYGHYKVHHNNQVTIHTIAQARFRPSLNMGLRVKSPKGAFSSLKGLFTTEQTFDDRYRVEAFDEDQVAKLFNPEMQRHFFLLNKYYVLLDDDFVRIQTTSRVDSKKTDWMIGKIARIHDELARSRKSLPPTATERKLIDSWGDLAKEEGMRFDYDGLKMQGRVGRFECQVRQSVEFSVGWKTRITLEFSQPLSADLQLEFEPSGLAAATTFLQRRNEHELGDKPFDDRFWIRGNQEKIDNLLQEDIRNRLLELTEDAIKFELTDNKLQLVFKDRLEDTSVLSRKLRALESLGELLHQRSVGDAFYR